MNQIFLRCLAVLLLTIETDRSCQAEFDSELKLSTERAIVFKDGYFLIAKTGTAYTDEQGRVYTDDVPDSAVLGSFWATAAEGRLSSIHAGWAESESIEDLSGNCRNTLEVLIANEGKQATVATNDSQTHHGFIVKVLAEKTSVAADASSLLSLFSLKNRPRMFSSKAGLDLSSQPLAVSLCDYQGTQFVLRTDEADLLLQVANIKTLAIKGMTSTISKTIQSTKKTKRLTFTTDSPGQRQTIHLFYFRPGIRWIPTYRVNLDSKAEPKMAKIELQAELLNEAEDLTDVPIDIVVGVPNFRFRDTISPLTLESTMRNALREAAPNLMGQMSNSFSNASFGQRSSEIRNNDATMANAVEGDTEIELEAELKASGSQELFVYNLPKTSMRKGDRCAVRIFEATCPYRDVYTWDLTLNRIDIEATPSGSGVKSPLTLSKNEVWRQVEITNTTNLPWTTGAVLMTEGQQPLSQELLTYTSPKIPCRVPLTVAIDVKSSYDETETDRRLNALNWNGHHYAKISKEAKLHVRNNKKVPIEIEVSMRLGGRVENASHEGQVTLEPFRQQDWAQYHGHPAVNNSSHVKWVLRLNPSEVVDPQVNYFYYGQQ